MVAIFLREDSVGQFFTSRCTKGIPDDARIVHVGYAAPSDEHDDGMIHIYVEHLSYADVPDLGHAPIQLIVYDTIGPYRILRGIPPGRLPKAMGSMN